MYKYLACLYVYAHLRASCPHRPEEFTRVPEIRDILRAAIQVSNSEPLEEKQ